MSVKRDYSWSSTGRTKTAAQGHIGASEANAIKRYGGQKTSSMLDSVGNLAHGLTAIGSAYLGYQQRKMATEDRASSYRIKAIQASVKAQQAKLQGKADILQMQTKFNRTMASNVVMSAAQMRSGGSVEAMASAAKEQFNWDVDFTELSAEIEATGSISQATQYGIAADATKSATLADMASTVVDVGTSLYSIGG